MLDKKSYFYKADDFPEIVVNPRLERKSLADSCHFKKQIEMITCPSCDGSGGYWTEYDFYPSGLPDSGWAHDYRRIYVQCPKCGGSGKVPK